MKKMFQLAALGLMVSITAVSCKKKETTTDGTAATTTSEPVTVDETTTTTMPDTTTTGVATDADLQRINDAIKDYPGVKAEMVNGGVVLTGDVSSEDARNIKMSVDALQLGDVQYNYTVK